MKEQRSSNIETILWNNTKPGVEVTVALLSPIAKRLAETGLIFASHTLQNNQTYRKVMRHLL